jgi:HAD superfamily phosphoserine phosphatase-like hydrolase
MFKNLKVNYLDSCAQDYISTESFLKNINQDVLSFIQGQENAKKIIVSANYSFLAEKIAKLLKIETCISINLDTSNGKYSGEILGQIPFGKEKISVVSDFINNGSYNKTKGIGDSKSDLPLLKYLNEGYLVSLNKKSDKTKLTRI